MSKMRRHTRKTELLPALRADEGATMTARDLIPFALALVMIAVLVVWGANNG